MFYSWNKLANKRKINIYYIKDSELIMEESKSKFEILMDHLVEILTSIID
ncbi:Uncharacterised protein [[Clostridium] sordellii]|nr:Uncharacterised protein [[Clostridium] sordellii] [Paeniclostridium sordellii]